MKIFLTAIFFLYSNTLLAQRTKTIRIEDGVSGKAITGKYFRLLQDNDTEEGLFKLNEQGLYKIPLGNYPLQASLQILFICRGYKTIRENLNLTDSTTQVIKIFPDPDYVPVKAGLFYRSTAIREFGEYEPATPNSLADLPDSIRQKLVNHLKDRLGGPFYSRLHLTYGQIVNLDRLYKVSHNAGNYKWTPYSYYLYFGFEDSAKGIGQYNASIVLDKQGQVVDEIELPDIKNNPEKSNIIPLGQIKKIAEKNGFDPKMRIELGFDRESNSITWNFTKVTNDQRFSFSYSVLCIDAHTGRVISTNSGSGVR